VPATVDEYLAALDPSARAELERLRAICRSVVPDATETISYQMPALRFENRVLIWYAAVRDHVSLFPASDAVKAALGADVEPFLSGRGTIRFRHRDPLPDDLVRRFVQARIAENRAPRQAETAS
jgi:uncharacterized protein YdhG (YjbR/CyaY superfamily)